MAFRRSNFRRRSGSRFGRGRRRGTGFRRSYRSKRGVNFRRYSRRRVTPRKVRNIASKKKQDTLLGSTSTDPNDYSNVIALTAGNNYFIYSPTYRGRDDNVNNHTRGAASCYYRGVRDRVMVASSFQLVHRRVCFWSHDQISAASPIDVSGDGINIDYTRRNMNQITPTTDTALFRQLFKGTVGIDFTEDSRWDSPIANNRVKVVFDRQYSVNPNYNVAEGNAFGKITTKKLWHPMNRTVMYDDWEHGREIDEASWGNAHPDSMGNFYILDMFSTGQDTPDDNTQVGSWSTETTVYWHETS